MTRWHDAGPHQLCRRHSARRGHDYRGHDMSNVAVMSVLHTRRAWVERECLRIAAGVKGATATNLAWRVYRMHRDAGASEIAANEDVGRVMIWLEGRLSQIAAIRMSPPPTTGGETCARG